MYVLYAAWVWRSEEVYVGPIFVGPRDQAQVDRLGSKSPSFLSHFADLAIFIIQAV